MARDTLDIKLKELGIPSSYFSLDGSLEEGAFILHNKPQGYEVFLFERGNRFELRKFPNENEACEYLYERLRRLKETNDQFGIPM